MSFGVQNKAKGILYGSGLEIRKCPPYPLVFLQREIGAALWTRGQKPKRHVTAGVAR